MKNRTGNGKRVAYFNEENLRVLQVLKKTPAYAGIRKDSDDTPIQIHTSNAAGSEANALQCSGKLVGETSALTRGINTGQL